MGNTIAGRVVSGRWNTRKARMKRRKEPRGKSICGHNTGRCAGTAQDVKVVLDRTRISISGMGGADKEDCMGRRHRTPGTSD